MKHWRGGTWAIVIWTVLAIVYYNVQRTQTFGLFLMVALVWFVGFVVLSLVWLMRRPTGSPPPG